VENLFLTPTRVALLQDVADGFVFISFGNDGGGYAEVYLQWASSRKPRKVTSRIEELRKAGLVRIGSWDDGHRCAYCLTVAGEMALANAGRSQ
jgi:hypothetical protein